MQTGTSHQNTPASQLLITQSATVDSHSDDSILGESAKLAVSLAVAVIIAIALFHSF